MNRLSGTVVSILVPCNNLTNSVYSNIVKIWESALEAGVPFEFIFVQDFKENLSNKPLLKRIRAFARVIPTNKHSGGSAVARQIGRPFARGKYLLFTDADTLPETGWVKKMVGYMENAPTTRCIYAGKVSAIRPKTATQKTEAFTDSYRFRGKEYSKLPFFTTQNVITPNNPDIFFDKCPRNYLEDLDLSFALRKKGYKILLANTTVYTTYPKTFAAGVRRKIKHGVGAGYVYSKYSKEELKSLLEQPRIGEYVRYLVRRVKQGKLTPREKRIFYSLSTIFIASSMASHMVYRIRKRQKVKLEPRKLK